MDFPFPGGYVVRVSLRAAAPAPCARDGCAALTGAFQMERKGGEEMLRKNLGWLAGLSACVLICFACQKQGPATGTSGAGAKKDVKGKVLAQVDGERISLEAFEAELDALPEYTRNQLKSKEQKLKRLDRMVEEILLKREAEKRGLGRDEEIQRKVERYRDRLITEELYKRVAQERANVTDAEIQKYYDEHRDQFSQKERIRASQVLILVPPNATPEKDAEAKAKAQEALRRAKAGEDFTELAKQYSEGPTASRGGDLGYFSRGRMVPEFEDVAFSLTNVGDISDVVKTKFGYHIVQLNDRQPEKVLGLDEVKDRIVRQLEAKNRRDIRQGLGQDLRRQAKIQISEEYLQDEEPATAGTETPRETPPPQGMAPAPQGMAPAPQEPVPLPAEGQAKPGGEG